MCYVYIGQSKHSLKFQIKVHITYIRNQDTTKSDIAKCKFYFDSSKIICKTYFPHALDLLVAFHVYKDTFHRNTFRKTRCIIKTCN